MGGGATIRAVAKAAGIGVVNSGLRGRLPENPVSAASRSIARPVAAIGTTSAADPVKPIGAYDDAVKSSCEFEDWDFADFGGDGVVVSDDKKMPRLVFGGTPTFEEAKEATSELKEVIERAYISSPVSPRFGTTAQDSSLSDFQSSEVQHNKYCLATENTVPTHAMQAFKFLNESPAVQVVVASIASDPNVWDSVLKNPALQDYLQTQKIDFSTQPLYPNAESVSDVDSHADGSPVDLETSSQMGEFNDQEFYKENELMKVWNNVKVQVADMVKDLSGFFQGLFGGNPSDKVSADSSTASGFFEKAVGPSLMGLVIMVIMVVVLKR